MEHNPEYYKKIEITSEKQTRKIKHFVSDTCFGDFTILQKRNTEKVPVLIRQKQLSVFALNKKAV
jgi:hypothetical protein